MRRSIAPLQQSSTPLLLAALILLGLGLRLLVWRWHEFYPLGGDEQEYFNQALRWLQGKGYHELQFMRPPLYTVFLAVVFQLFDSQVQRVRLVQALISTGTIGLVWLWAREVWAGTERGSRAALATAGIAALCYTFAANATELLTETLFVAGLTLALWLVLRAANARHWRWAVLAGIVVGLLSLLRSVGLPLVPLAVLWLLMRGREQRNNGTTEQRTTEQRTMEQQNNRTTEQRVKEQRVKEQRVKEQRSIKSGGQRAQLLRWLLVPLCFVFGSVLIIAPWTLRNYLLYHTPIIIDTTGAENLWLDNDPAGREAVKAQLYALGDDRGLRQRLGMERGLAVVTGDPARFTAKAWAEAQKFVAFEYFDDLRARRAIWVPPLEVWLRLVLGDGIWLLVLFGGIAGLWLSPHNSLKWLLVPWALYIVLTGLLFHVELRYRLPLYPALLPYAGWLVVRALVLPRRVVLGWRGVGALATMAAVGALVLLHRPYPSEGALLARKHLRLWQAAQARDRGQMAQAAQHAQAALTLDPDSALARVALGLAAQGEESERWWRDAITVLPDHPYAHLLLGNRLRTLGNLDTARRELVFEANSLEDLQRWSLRTFDQRAVARVDLGSGLDLGLISGFHLAQDEAGARWSRAGAAVHQLALESFIHLRLAGPRPPSAAPAVVQVALDNTPLGTIEVGADWQAYTFEVPEALRGRVATLSLSSTTFRPRAYDRASPDNRVLGVQVDWVATTGTRTVP